jgi:glutathione S-transferase
MKKNPNGKIPILETSEGVIYESNAIMRHVARVSGHKSILGSDAFEQA